MARKNKDSKVVEKNLGLIKEEFDIELKKASVYTDREIVRYFGRGLPVFGMFFGNFAKTVYALSGQKLVVKRHLRKSLDAILEYARRNDGVKAEEELFGVFLENNEAYLRLNQNHPEAAKVMADLKRLFKVRGNFARQMAWYGDPNASDYPELARSVYDEEEAMAIISEELKINRRIINRIKKDKRQELFDIEMKSQVVPLLENLYQYGTKTLTKRTEKIYKEIVAG